MTVQDAARLLAGGRAVAFTGAGISQESGIPTFRDPGGLWDRFDPGEHGTWEGMARLAMGRPDDLARFLAEVRRTFAAARPNAAHDALARLERGGLLDGVVTQNVDGLHRDAGSSNVVEVHGSFRTRVCLAQGHREAVGREEFLEGLDRAIAALRTAFIPSLASLLPRCAACGAPSRPGFVAFGEPLVGFAEAERMVEACATLLVVGTSAEVEPAAALIRLAQERGAALIDVGPAPTWLRPDVRLHGRAARVLPHLVERALAEPRR